MTAVSPKGPKTTELPDWEKAYDELADRHRRLMRIIVGLRAIGRSRRSVNDRLPSTRILRTLTRGPSMMR